MTLLLAKFALSVTFVLVLSNIAERVNPKWAGLLSGLPTGTAVSLFFIALENGLDFARHSAVYNLLGIVASQSAICGYYLASLHAARHKALWGVAGTLAGYFAGAGAMSLVPFSLPAALALPIASSIVFSRFFSRIDDGAIAARARSTFALLAGRALIAAGIIIAITGVAHLVGPTWAGLFSAFPSTILPLVLIIHLTYGEKCAHAIIKYAPAGMGGVLTYSLILHLAYPGAGLYGGVALAYLGAFLYVAAYKTVETLRRKA